MYAADNLKKLGEHRGSFLGHTLNLLKQKTMEQVLYACVCVCVSARSYKVGAGNSEKVRWLALPPIFLLPSAPPPQH